MKKYKEFLNENNFIDYRDYDFNNIISMIEDDVLLIQEQYEELTKEYNETKRQITTLQFNRDLLKTGFNVEEKIDKLSRLVADIILQFEENKRRMILNSLEDFISRHIDGKCVYLISHQIIDSARYKIK